MASPIDPAVPRLNGLIGVAAQIALQTGVIMSNVADLMAKIAELQSGQVELIKDVQRLIADGDTSAAIAKLDELKAANEALDAAVEVASPEPAPVEPPVTEPVAEAPADAPVEG